MKNPTAKTGYPLYDVCYKKKDGTEKVVSECVPLKKGIEAIKKFDNLILTNGAVVRDILYCYLMPRRDLKPHFDMELGTWIYKKNHQLS